VTFGTDLTDENLKKCANLKWLHLFSAGLDTLPIESLKNWDILVTNSRGIHAIPMAEHTIAAILNFCRQSQEFFKNQQQKKWDRSIRMTEAYEKVLGIIGVGAIGSCIANRAKALGMNVLGVNTTGDNVEYVDKMYTIYNLHQMLHQCDFVVMVLPFTSKTYKVFGESEFKCMRNTAYFINISRGQVVDQDALIRSLKEKWIAGAALDVFADEPLPDHSPLWSMDNVMITPHTSGWSDKYMIRAVDILLQNMYNYQSRQANLINHVNLKREY